MVTSPTTVTVVLVLVPPAIENPFANDVGVTPLIVLFVRFCTLSSVTYVDSIEAVSAIFNFKAAALAFAEETLFIALFVFVLNSSILFDKVMVSAKLKMVF